jgi:hypothetical protein
MLAGDLSRQALALALLPLWRKTSSLLDPISISFLVNQEAQICRRR